MLPQIMISALEKAFVLQGFTRKGLQWVREVRLLAKEVFDGEVFCE